MEDELQALFCFASGHVCENEACRTVGLCQLFVVEDQSPPAMTEAETSYDQRSCPARVRFPHDCDEVCAMHAAWTADEQLKRGPE